MIVPGMVLASMFRPESITEHLPDVMVGMLSAAAIASANYVLNEWLDRPFDAQNPRKAPCANNR